ncbi:MAG: T9SS type A sorting domain-containing protein [Sphingobacteriales bacterium]|nr:MAG: T9SS type A sorting domain-containing protein [Sphingobacteriales bacterium]
MVRLYLLMLAFFSFVAIQAQSITPSVINSTGNFVPLNNEYYQWSVGETYINMDVASNIIVSSGFVQPDQDFITKIKETIKANELGIYPNPVYNQLTVNTDFEQNGTLKYKVYQVDGKLLFMSEKHITTKELFLIDFDDISAGNYILDFTFENESNKKSYFAFKVQKKY